MTIVMGAQDALESIIPFDTPKHPRLPANRFPKGGKAGTIVQAGRVAWITGKYLYKYRKKWLAMGLALSVSTSLYKQDASVPSGNVPNKFHKTYPGRGRGFSQRSKFNKHFCKCRPKRRFNNFRSRKR